jgi:hypothetical protein
VTSQINVIDEEGNLVQVIVRYSITEAEPACWRDVDGDGHPGWPRSVELRAVSPDDEWVRDYVEANWEVIEQEILTDGMA